MVSNLGLYQLENSKFLTLVNTVKFYVANQLDQWNQEWNNYDYV